MQLIYKYMQSFFLFKSLLLLLLLFEKQSERLRETSAASLLRWLK